MADGSTASVLRRKTENTRASGPGEARGPLTPGRALSDAIRRAAEEEMELSVMAGEPKERRATPAELLEGLPEHAFLGILIGPEDASGLFCLDPAALAAILEMRTMGRVTARPPTPRRPTTTDAAMVSDLIDRILSEFETPLLATEDARWCSGWRYQMFLPDPRPLSIVLEEASHRVLESEIIFGAAAKPGRVIIALPATGRAFPRPPEPPPTDSAEAASAAGWRRAMGEAVETTEAALDAVLGRVRLPLSELAKLAPGDRIVLPLAALGTVRLVAPGGKTITEGRLGQTGGLRAVKLGDLTQEPASQSAEGKVIPAGTLARAVGNRHPGPDLSQGGFQAALASASPGDYGNGGFDAGGEFPDLDTGSGDLPDLGGGGGFPALNASDGGLPSLGSAMGDLPQMGSFDLPDLPDLPELPD